MYSLPSSASSDKLLLQRYVNDHQQVGTTGSAVSEQTRVWNRSTAMGEAQGKRIICPTSCIMASCSTQCSNGVLICPGKDVRAVAGPTSSSPAITPSVGFKFVNIVDPSQAKNPRLMRGVRQHAMNHHLAQAGRSVSVDPRNHYVCIQFTMRFAVDSDCLTHLYRNQPVELLILPITRMTTLYRGGLQSGKRGNQILILVPQKLWYCIRVGSIMTGRARTSHSCTPLPRRVSVQVLRTRRR